MSELAKTEVSGISRRFGDHFAIAMIVVLLIAVQAMFIAKHTVTLNAAGALAAVGTSAP
jgi:hypothetical protein